MVQFMQKDAANGQSPQLVAIFSNVSIFRETLRMISKFHENFGIRSLINCEVPGLTSVYLQNLYKYTVEAFKCSLPNKKQIISELMAQINNTWYRISLEVVQTKSEC
jgi:hypothetical protein